MTVAIIAHVEEDRAYVEALITALNDNRFIVCAIDPAGPPLAFDARLPLVLIWSARAARARATRVYASLIRSHAGETILCAADHHAPPKEFDRLSCARVDGAPGSAFYPGGLAAAVMAVSMRSARREEPPLMPNFSGRAFAGGLARGLAGGVAVLGVGAGAALAFEALSQPEAQTVADASFSVMDVSVPADEAVDPFGYPAPVEAEPPQAIVELAKQALRQSSVPLASEERAVNVARKVVASFADRPLRTLEVWSPDPELVAPLEAVAQGPDLDLFGDGEADAPFGAEAMPVSTGEPAPSPSPLI